MAIQADMFTHPAPGFADLIAGRAARYGTRALSVDEVAAVLQLGASKVRELIECGRIPAANLNADMTVAAADGSARPLRPLWRVTAEAVIEFAKNAERGC